MNEWHLTFFGLQLMHTIQPSRCRLYKYLPAIVHCAAQTHDNTVGKFGEFWQHQFIFIIIN
jgi:hypothetical protein